MTYINSNLTNREAYAQYGKLDEERMQKLLDIEDNYQPWDNVHYVQEASAQYPEEDFLQDDIKALQRLVKNVRGDNKATLLGVIATLEDLQLQQARATEYGREELGKIK